jgi:hypothetical protein
LLWTGTERGRASADRVRIEVERRFTLGAWDFCFRAMRHAPFRTIYQLQRN